MAVKLERRIKIESLAIRLMIVGLTSMNKGDNITILKEKMGAFLAEEVGSGKGKKGKG